MNCDQFWNRLPNPPGTDLEQGPEQRAHLAECPACAARLARQREIAGAFRRVAESYQGIEAPARVEARLVRAFRTDFAPGRNARPRAGKQWFGYVRPYFAVCAAGAVLLAAGLYLGSIRTPAPPQSAGAPASADLAAAALEMDAGMPEGFIPLPNAERLSPNEDVNVVRLEVPRSAMLAVGIPVSADQASDSVEADLLLGSDGRARAVRFLE
jgi:hypothetical protein